MGRQTQADLLAQRLVYLDGDDASRRLSQAFGQNPAAGAHLDDGIARREASGCKDALEDTPIGEEVLAQSLTGSADGGFG
jgi:hypothetical protein